MSELNAICIHCGKSVNFQRNGEDRYVCPYCARSFSYVELTTLGNIVDYESARMEYVKAQQYFAKGDYQNAEIYFNHVRDYDKNNFFAEYFYILSGLLLHGHVGRVLGLQTVMSLIDLPIVKMVNSSQPNDTKKMFLVRLFTDLYSMIKKHYEAIDDGSRNVRESERADEAYLNFAKKIRAITLLDVEAVMAKEQDIGNKIVSICDLAMKACERVQSVRSINGNLVYPSAQAYDEAKSLFSVYSYFVKKIVPSYMFPHYKASKRDLNSYLDSVIVEISEFHKKHDVKGEDDGKNFEHISNLCKSALSYTYHTLFNMATLRKNEDSSQILLKAIGIALELFVPNVSVDTNKSINITSPILNDYETITGDLNNLIYASVLNTKEKTDALLKSFFARLYDIVFRYYGSQKFKIKSELDFARSRKNKAYFYYRNFLYGIVCTALPALNDVIAYVEHKSADRINLLKTCKEACEDLLFLFDYRMSEIEKTEKFDKLRTIYSQIITSIKNG